MAPRKKTIVAPVPAAPTPVPESVPVQEPIPVVPEPAPVPIKAKREKKTSKHKVVAVITPNGIEGSFQSEVRRPLIAQLPIHTSDIQFHDQPIIYDPRPPCQPEAFNADWSDPFATEAMFETAPEKESTNTIISQNITEQSSAVESTVQLIVQPIPQTAPATISRKEYGPTTLLVQFANTKYTKELPNDTELACFWCCEVFSGRPCVIPNHISLDVWHVYGNYCTPQCAMAYLLSEILDTHTRWERIALLNRLYAKQINGRIYPAPSRESLQRFGGPISPEHFHSMCENQTTRVDIHMPPMVSILASMDTKPIDFYETPLRNTFASPYQVSIQRKTDEAIGLKLRRTKPLKDKESTLDACFQSTLSL
jgi:hypothetical protein